MARWTAPLLVTVTFIGLLAVGFWQARKHLPSPSEWGRLLETELQATLSVPVKIGSAEIGLNGATIRKLMIQPDSRSPTGYVLTVPELKLRWSWWQILRPSQWKRVVQAQVERALHQIIIANATLFLWRDRMGPCSFGATEWEGGMFKPSLSSDQLALLRESLRCGFEMGL